MPDVFEFDEIRLRITRSADGGYRAAATAADDSHGEAAFVRPFSDEDLDDFVGKVDPIRARGGRWGSELMNEAEAFGTRLAEALFAGEVRDVYRTAKERASTNRRGLRISLGLGAVPELMEIPWEFLYEHRGFVAQSVRTPVVRSLEVREVRPPAPVEGPLRILAVVSQPVGERPLDVDREKERLEGALEELIGSGSVVLDWLKPPTLGALEERIARSDDIHVLHFIGHGAYEEQSASGVLSFEDVRGRRRDVTGQELCSVLQDEWALRLAVLNACEGARNSHVDPFSGVAASLLECGVSAVVGMQFSVSDSAAALFAGRFYRLLADGYPIDAAVARTRVALSANDFGVEFATPVLFLRGAQTRLFDLQVRPERPKDELERKQEERGRVEERAREPMPKPDGADDDSGLRQVSAVLRIEIVQAGLTTFVCRLHTQDGTHLISAGSTFGGSEIRLDGELLGTVEVETPFRFAVRDGTASHQIEMFRSVANWWGRFWFDMKIDGEYVIKREKLVERPDPA